MIGGAVSLIPGVGQIAGPLIALAGNLFGGLFGDEGPKLPPLAGAHDERVDLWRRRRNQWDHGPLGEAAQMARLYMLAGGVNKPGRRLRQRDLAAQPARGDFRPTSYITNPDGSSRVWGEGSGDQSRTVDSASADSAYNTLMNGVKLTDTMRQALSKFNGVTFDSVAQIEQIVAEVNGFEAAIKDLGKTTTDAETALKGIDDQFASL